MAGDPYQQRYLLYGMHFFYSMISRMWDMGITLVLASLTNNNMSLIALAGLMSSLLIFLFMAQIGKQFLDIYNRLYVVRVFLLLKLCTVSVSYILCILFAYAQRENHIQSDSVKDSSMLDVSFREWIDKFPRNIIGGTTLDGMFNAMPLVGQSLAARALTFSSTDADSNMGHGTYQMMNNRSFLQSRYLESSTSSFHDTIVTNGIYIIPFLYALTNISFTCITQCIEKDWVVVLSNSNSEWLASTNATMSQIDLICASLAPTITGFLFYFYGHDTANKSASENTSDSTNVAVILLLLNALATVALLFFLTYLYNSWGQLAVRASDSPQNANYAFIDTTSKHNNTNTNESEYGSSEQDDEITIELSHRAIHSMSLEDESNIDQKALMTRQKEASYIASIFQKVSVSFISSITNFRSSNCAGVMISYAFLYCTVLSYGSLMTIYLRWAGVSDYIIGLTRGISSVTGFIGASIFPYCSRKYGLFLTGRYAITYQCVLVVIAASSYFYLQIQQSVYVVITAVILSRIGLWYFDLAVRQIAQEQIPEAIRGEVNGLWRSIIAFFDMSAYALATICPRPSQFWILTSVSATMVTIAMILYSFSEPSTSLDSNIRSEAYSEVSVSVHSNDYDEDKLFPNGQEEK